MGENHGRRQMTIFKIMEGMINVPTCNVAQMCGNQKKKINNYHSELFDGNEHSLDSRMALVIMS